MPPHDHGLHHDDHDHGEENPATATRPFDDAAPVFDEPWQAQALALADTLKARGHFSAADWASALGGERARQAASGAADTNQSYFEAVIAALETLTAAAIPPETRAARRAAWEAAYLKTPHGRPVLLDPRD